MSPTCEYPPQHASEEQGDVETSSPRKWVVALRALAQPTSNLCCCQCDQGQASQPAQTPSQAKRNEGKKSDFNQPSLACNPNTKSEFHQDNVELFSLWRARSAISEISWEAARMRFCKTTAVLCKRKNLESSRSLQLCQLDRKTEKQKLHWKSTVFYQYERLKILKKPIALVKICAYSECSHPRQPSIKYHLFVLGKKYRNWWTKLEKTSWIFFSG